MKDCTGCATTWVVDTEILSTCLPLLPEWLIDARQRDSVDCAVPSVNLGQLLGFQTLNTLVIPWSSSKITMILPARFTFRQNGAATRSGDGSRFSIGRDGFSGCDLVPCVSRA